MHKSKLIGRMTNAHLGEFLLYLLPSLDQLTYSLILRLTVTSDLVRALAQHQGRASQEGVG